VLVNDGQKKFCSTSGISDSVPYVTRACLYIGKYEGFDVLICQQTDEFMFGGESEASLRSLVSLI
jgi:hypothetical protein